MEGMREAGSLKPEARRTTGTACGFWLLACGVLIAGCGPQSPTTQPSDDIVARQDQALRDPFGYSVDPKKPDNTVSGNGEFDKQGLKRDIDHVLNP